MFWVGKKRKNSPLRQFDDSGTFYEINTAAQVSIE
jgi:hypothetical protein